MKTSVILLAGGSGLRMKTSTPKQFLPLKDKPVARHSFDVFCAFQKISEIIVVCDPAYRFVFLDPVPSDHLRIAFAEPGCLRQNSVYNGLQKVAADCELVCIHDAARPFIDQEMVVRSLEGAKEYGAITTAVPVKPTIKRSTPDGFVVETLDRTSLWEVQTPQIIRKDLLEEGFVKSIQDHLTVTDDVSLVEHLLHPVKLIEGSYKNIKITTPEDLLLAEFFLKNRENA